MVRYGLARAGKVIESAALGRLGDLLVDPRGEGHIGWFAVSHDKLLTSRLAGPPGLHDGRANGEASHEQWLLRATGMRGPSVRRLHRPDIRGRRQPATRQLPSRHHPSHERSGP